jgi:hypothetical protein
VGIQEQACNTVVAIVLMGWAYWSMALVSFLSMMASPMGNFGNGSNYLFRRKMTDGIGEAVWQVLQLPHVENPVKKVVLVLSGNKCELYLDELEVNHGGSRGGNGGAC